MKMSVYKERCLCVQECECPLLCLSASLSGDGTRFHKRRSCVEVMLDYLLL